VRRCEGYYPGKIRVYLLVVYDIPEAFESLLTFQIMPHVKPFCETMEEFVAVHKVQLLSSSIPEHLWESLYLKLKLEVMSNRTARKSSSGVPQRGGQC